ncbi:MAG: Ni/Fe hydrogenase subunit alpha [Desulfarculaceae bacterium]|jgi:NAD-reducing hydrogenase large subunit
MATTRITIDPVSRIEGHAKVTVNLDEKGEVNDAQMHVTQFRGFEAFCQGRPFEEMPIITQRICGICPVSHQLASAKAGDAILGHEIPPTARLLRELLHMGQFIQSHALHFFYLASPDLLLGWDSDPATRNVVGVIAKYPQAATQGVRLRKFGQEIIKALGGKKVHPAFSIPGGVTNPLSQSDRERLLSGFAEARETCNLGLDLVKDWIKQNLDEVRRFANFDSLYAGLVDEKGYINLYHGQMRITDSSQKTLVQFPNEEYLDFIGERVEPWSYMKFPYLKSRGYPQGLYRVGPLGRVTASEGFSTPLADNELQQLWEISAGQSGGSLLYHYARLIEILYALERAEALLQDERICHSEVLAAGKPRHRQGIGVIEAPRGTLIHHYWVDESGAMEKANLIVATGHNNLAMNKSVTLVAQEYIHNGQVKEGMLNRIEGAIRCYDPCLSCATHAVGQMPLLIQVRGPDGKTLHQLQRP